MSNIAVSNDWPAGVYQYADGDVLDGGADSSEVLPLKQLANRSLFQRLANVTLWDSALAAEFGYPNKACVMHAGQSWRAVVANNVEPGTDGTKWERWGYSASELADVLSGLSGGTFVHSSTGWEQHPSGLIFQWGQASATPINPDSAASPGFGYYGAAEVVFPVAFPEALYHVSITRQDANVSELNGHSASRSQSGFTLVMNNAQSGVLCTSDWFAIGK